MLTLLWLYRCLAASKRISIKVLILIYLGDCAL